MNGFLVSGGNAVEVTPLRLCSSRKEAADFAPTVSVEMIGRAFDRNQAGDLRDIWFVYVQEFADGRAGPLEVLVDLGTCPVPREQVYAALREAAQAERDALPPWWLEPVEEMCSENS
jgi:hypothetical protein